MVGHKKVDKWRGHAGNICFTEKLADHLFNNNIGHDDIILLKEKIILIIIMTMIMIMTMITITIMMMIMKISLATFLTTILEMLRNMLTMYNNVQRDMIKICLKMLINSILMGWGGGEVRNFGGKKECGSIAGVAGHIHGSLALALSECQLLTYQPS